MTKVLIVVSTFHKEVLPLLLKPVINRLEKKNISYDKLEVPGALEIPATTNIALESFEYDGVITLGCVIRGETINFEMVVQESLRALQDISIYYSMPLGYGVIAANNLEQALNRGKSYGENAVKSCLAVMKIKASYCNEHDSQTYN